MSAMLTTTATNARMIFQLGTGGLSSDGGSR